MFQYFLNIIINFINSNLVFFNTTDIKQIIILYNLYGYFLILFHLIYLIMVLYGNYFIDYFKLYKLIINNKYNT